MIRKLRNFFTAYGRFRLPMDRSKLPYCKVRLILDSDFDVCEEIYRSNEAKHFPSSHFPEFSAWLRRRNSLVVVVESDNEIIGFGGLDIDENSNASTAGLAYGMVRSIHAGRGFGTVLLLSRLFLLPTPKKNWFVVLLAAGGSETFYRRFGFRYLATELAEDNALLRAYLLDFRTKDRRICRSLLKHVTLDPAIFELPIPRRKHPAD